MCHAKTKSSCFPGELDACERSGQLGPNLLVHEPLRAFTPDTHAYVTMLREPNQRAVSGFHVR